MKLKLLEKLKKLKLIKYRYKISTSLTSYQKKKYLGYHYSFDDDNVCFYKHKLDKEMLKDDSLIIEDRLSKLFCKLFKTNLLSSISILLIFGLFILSNYFIRDIKFSNESTYNYNVLQDVKKEIHSFGPFHYMNIDLNELSNNLRKKYFDYAYIGVHKKAGTIYIDIEQLNEYPEVEVDNVTPCDVLSLVDGKVVGFEVERGIPIVGINQIIKKGDTLITGNINYQINPFDTSKFINAHGVVLIEYATYEKIIIPKSYTYNEYSIGNEKHYEILLFNKKIGNNRIEEKNKVLVNNLVFSFGNILILNEVIEYKVKQNTIFLQKDVAKQLSLMKIYQSFFEQQVSEKEEIKLVKYIRSEENDDNYVFYYLIKYIKNATIKEEVLSK